MGSGLSEVRFYYAPAQARAPQPTAGATGQSLTTMLSWRPGRDMTSHQVYFGTDPNAVANGTVTAKTVTDHTFDPGALLYGTTYYWRVDGIDAAGIYRGEVWSFTTQEFSPVDDFESYNDTNHRLRDTWIDGLTDGKSGSVVGYLTAPSAEQTIVHGGTQSMPLAYDNRKTPFYSETTRDLGTPQDWTGHGATHLDLWFRGYPATGMTTPTNAPASLYLTVVDNVGKSGTVVHPNPSATNVADWTEWRIPLGDLMAAGIQMTQVQKITLGVGAKSSPKAGGTGMLYLDDLGLGHPVDAPIQARAPQPADGATGQSVTTTLRWQSDRAGASHKVFFGTNWDAVAYGTAAAQTVTDPAFDPGPLTYGTTYYWRVDEVSTVTCPGEVWSFTIREFTVVDDFESYNNTDNRIYDTWIDGLADGKSGSAVGYMTAPFAEQKIVHGGHQSMPLSYDNTKAPFSSETTRDLGVPQDWTGHGATHLDLWFKGSPGGPGTPFNYPSSLYLTVTDKAGKSKTVSNPMNPVAVQMVDWTEWRIRLSDLTGVSLTTVQKITLRVSSMVTSKAGGAGLLYFDDIGFGHPVK
jgi:hypothetical protein